MYRIYYFLVTLPERLYPFACTIEGQRVRWRRSYEHTLMQIQERIGAGRYGIRLSAYREACHVLGAGLFIVLATGVSKFLGGSAAVLPTMFITALIVITIQEFYIHPRHYQQRFGKSIADWLSWMVPIGLYLFIFGL